ncbi:MAG: hypothetical protein KGY99_08380 [Phycisphaerae bacterium]|nr:hypothetical protein [Phycisphaerae bacterium]
MHKHSGSYQSTDCVGDGVYLPPPVAEHLRAALDQMRRLRRTAHTETGMCYLQAMLQHLEAVRRAL